MTPLFIFLNNIKTLINLKSISKLFHSRNTTLEEPVTRSGVAARPTVFTGQVIICMTSIHHGVTKQTDVICEDVTPATQTILPAPISTVFSLAGIRGNVIAKANPQFVTVQ